MRLHRESTGETFEIRADEAAIGSGGEARILAITALPGLAAKLYHQTDSAQSHKLEAMLANPPVDPMEGQAHVSIAWPIDRLTTPPPDARFVGFLMPRVSNAYPLFQYYNPASRRQIAPLFSYRYLLRAARNLAAAVRAIHDCGYVIGDLNESNILVTSGALVTLVDTDSFQVPDPSTGRVYRCTVGKAEFTPAELAGRSFSEIDRTVSHDLFGLGVLLFQTLLEGTHPFGGQYTGAGDPPTYDKRISEGYFPYGLRSGPIRPGKAAPPFNLLPPNLRSLFLRCFEDGHQNAAIRPTAATWLKALQECEEQLVICSRNGQHQYGNHLVECPWCERTRILGGKDPFPTAEQAVIEKEERRHADAERALRRLDNMPTPAMPTVYGSYNSAGYSVSSSSSQPVPAPAIPPIVLYTFSMLPNNPLAWIALASFVLAAALQLFGAFVPALVLAILTVPTSMVGHLRSKRAVGHRGGGGFLAAVALVGGLWTGMNASADIYFSFHPPAERVIRMVSAAHAAAFLPDGKTLVTGTSRAEDQRLIGGLVQEWDCATGRLKQTLAEYAGSVASIVVSPDGRYAVTASYSPLSVGSVDLVDTHSPGVKISQFVGDRGQPCTSISADGGMLAVGSLAGNVRTLSTMSRVPSGSVTVRGEALSITFSRDGRRLLVGSGSPPGSILSGAVSCFDTIHYQLLWRHEAHGNAVLAMRCAPDGKTLVTGGNDSRLNVWDIATGTRIREIETGGFRTTALQISRSGACVAAAIETETETETETGGDAGGFPICIWSTATWFKTQSLSGHRASVTALDISQDETMIATAALDSTVRLWRIPPDQAHRSPHW